MSSKAHNRIVSERTGLIMREPFFGPLALRLELVEDKECPAAWTDGVSLGYNPEFIGTLSNDELTGLICHEVMHVANGHPWRRQDREQGKWNMACDYAINQELEDAGFKLPPGGLVNKQYNGNSAEGIYAILPDMSPDDKGGGGDGGSDSSGNGPGEVRDAPQDAPEGSTEEDWQGAVEQAAMNAKKAGKLPSSLDRLVRAIRLKDTRDLVSAILEWANRVNRNDYSWKRPNNRYMPHGLYMPCLHGVSMPPIIGAVDTSGSVYPDLLARYTDALQRVLEECKPECLVVYSCDAKVQDVRQYETGDTVEGKFPGGGGTDFRPVFKDVEKCEEEFGHGVSGLIYLTDLVGAFPDKAPDYPVLWVVYDPGARRIKAPFGETIWIM